MGLFDEESSPRSNELVEEQITQNRAELEEKRHSLAEQRMAIVKSQGGENWVADRNASYSSGAAKQPPRGGWFNGFIR
ncbi:hypothetical protein KW791_00040 [Candidatus Parcubacteria bacterium]|nr:hypothetical protein [Candidatus Parcubacteria bacterium]